MFDESTFKPQAVAKSGFSHHQAARQQVQPFGRGSYRIGTDVSIPRLIV